MFFCDPAIDMLEDAAGEIGIVACMGIDRGGGTHSEEMRVDGDTSTRRVVSVMECSTAE